jgi:hypothetical protein
MPTLSEQIFGGMAVEELWAKLQRLRKEQKQKQEKEQQEKEDALAKEKAALEQKANEEKSAEEQGHPEAVEASATEETASTEQQSGTEQQAGEEEKLPEITVETTPETKVSTADEQQPKSETVPTENIIESSISSLANSSLSEGSEFSSSQTAHAPVDDKAKEQKSKYELWEEIKIKSKHEGILMDSVTKRKHN